MVGVGTLNMTRKRATTATSNDNPWELLRSSWPRMWGSTIFEIGPGWLPLLVTFSMNIESRIVPLRQARARVLRYNRALRRARAGGGDWLLYHWLWKDGQPAMPDSLSLIERSESRKKLVEQLVSHGKVMSVPSAPRWPQVLSIDANGFTRPMKINFASNSMPRDTTKAGAANEAVYRFAVELSAHICQDCGSTYSHRDEQPVITDLEKFLASGGRIRTPFSEPGPSRCPPCRIQHEHYNQQEILS